MFYNLTEEQIQKIKQKLYPQEVAGEFLKNVIVNDYGSTEFGDNSLRITFGFKDGLENDAEKKQIFKIFNNQKAIKYIKLKLFEVSSAKMLQEVQSAINNISDLENVISSYGALSQDLIPSLQFNGDKINPDAHVRFEELNNAIELVYDTTFLLRRPKIGYFTLCAVFYIDKNEYVLDQGVEEKFIDSRILVNKLLTYQLYNADTIVDNAPVQDLRLIKSTFKETGVLENILNIIVSGRGLPLEQDIKAQVEQSKITTVSPRSENIIRAIKLGQEKIIKAIKIQKKQKKSFSNILFSRNSNKELAMMFSVNYEQILSENTSHNMLLKTSSLKEEFIKKCKLSTVRVMRRAVKKAPKGNYLIQPDTTTALISSGETKDSNVITEKNEDFASLSEIKVNGNQTTDVRSFVVSDKKVFFNTAGLYQYGVELVVSNGINKFLTDHADDMMKHVMQLRDYLEETNKIATTRIDKNGSLVLAGSYDAQRNAFTPQFIVDFNKRRGLAPSYQDIVADAAANFAGTIKLLGLMKDSEKTISDTIIALLQPTQTRAESIAYFIKIYERLINQIRRMVKDNYNNTFTVQHWFSNDYVDNSMPINVGYRFFNFNEYRGLGVLNNLSFNNRIISDLNRYSLNPNLDTNQFTNTLYSYISPNEVYSRNKVLNLASLSANKDAISNTEFAELEIDIKNLNYYGITAEAETNEIPVNKRLTQKKVIAAMNSNKLGNFAGVFVKNAFKEKDVKFVNQTVDFQQSLPKVKNTEIDETNLMLALAKQIDVNKKTYVKAVTAPISAITPQVILSNKQEITNKISKLNDKDITEKLNTKENDLSQQVNILTTTLPAHVKLLLDDKNPLLNSAQNYKTSLDLNSKFQFLFNTLHSIEILEYDNETMDENWKLLTVEQATNIQANNILICRLRSYSNSLFGIDGLEQISLPIYEQYFMLVRSAIPAIAAKENLLNKEIVASKFAAVSKLSSNVLNAVQQSRTTQTQSTPQTSNKTDPFSRTRTNKGKA